jgi:hypothetical protein
MLQLLIILFVITNALADTATFDNYKLQQQASMQQYRYDSAYDRVLELRLYLYEHQKELQQELGADLYDLLLERTTDIKGELRKDTLSNDSKELKSVVVVDLNDTNRKLITLPSANALPPTAMVKEYEKLDVEHISEKYKKMKRMIEHYKKPASSSIDSIEQELTLITDIVMDKKEP